MFCKFTCCRSISSIHRKLKNNDFLISENLKINEPELLFSRIEDSEIQKQIDKLNKNN